MERKLLYLYLSSRGGDVGGDATPFSLPRVEFPHPHSAQPRQLRSATAHGTWFPCRTLHFLRTLDPLKGWRTTVLQVLHHMPPKFYGVPKIRASTKYYRTPEGEHDEDPQRETRSLA